MEKEKKIFGISIAVIVILILIWRELNFTAATNKAIAVTIFVLIILYVLYLKIFKKEIE